MIKRLARCGSVIAVVSLAVGFTAAAVAMPTCEGTYSAMALKPLPAQIVVGLDIRDRSPENLKLAERFLAGIREAGIAVGTEPNVLLHVGRSRLDLSTERSDRRVERNYSEMSGLQGGMRISPPAIPDARFGTPRPSREPPPLSIRVDATAGPVARVSWTAVVRCRRSGTDDGALAQDLGRVIGGSLGRKIDSGPV